VGRGRRVHARGRAAVTLSARTRTAGYPNQQAHPCTHQEHARTLTHSTDRNDALGLAYLARAGFFKPVPMRALSAHALRSLIIAGKKTGGQRATLESQIRGLAAVLENTIRRFQSPAVRKHRSFAHGPPRERRN
jgi:transposase